MNPAYLRRDDLHLGHLVGAVAAAPDGRRLYVGRIGSDDQARENLGVLAVEPATGAVLRRTLFRDADAPLPPCFPVPIARRPRAAVASILVAPRYRKLYLAADLDLATGPRPWLSVYELDEAGDPVPSSLRAYRVDTDAAPAETHVEALALHPVADVLYLTGGKWTALRWHRLDPTGEPLDAQPAVLPLAGSPLLTPCLPAGRTTRCPGGRGSGRTGRGTSAGQWDSARWATIRPSCPA
jgi:hypothetical protein